MYMKCYMYQPLVYKWLPFMFEASVELYKHQHVGLTSISECWWSFCLASSRKSMTRSKYLVRSVRISDPERELSLDTKWCSLCVKRGFFFG